MSRKNHNSVLFLTTLGVYLGLVLVGATPQVLAQAATTKQFSVKDEIDRRERLDSDPELSPTDYDRLVIQYVNGIAEMLSEIRSVTHFDSGRELSQTEVNVLRSCVDSRILGSHVVNTPVARELIPVLAEVQTRAESLSWFGDCLTNEVSGDKPASKTLVLRFSLDNDKFEYTAQFKFRSAIASDDALDELSLSRFGRIRSRDYDGVSLLGKKLLDLVYLEWTGQYVSLGIRLPRGSLNSLLASNAQ